MPPRNFSFNPAKASATQRIYEKGAYELVIGEPKVFARTNAETQKESFGITFPCRMAEGEFVGETYLHNMYMHFDGFEGMVKQFQMAALGYERNREDEERFNADHGGDDWSIDFDAKTCGQGWHGLTGNRIVANFDIGVNRTNGEPNQKVQWAPLGS
jgi:hypothetical protein